MHDYTYSLLVDTNNDATSIDDTFLTNLYTYFLHGGYYNIIIDDAIDILISTFMILFVKFIYSCIDFIGIFTNNGNKNIDEFINWNKFSNFNIFTGISLIVFVIYIIMRVIIAIDNIIKFKKIKKFYNETLNIRDMEIRTYKWEKIISKIVQTCHNTTNLNVYTVSNRIMKKDNILISLWDNKIIPFTHLNSFVELNLKFCFLFPLRDDKNNISTDKLKNTQEYKNKVKYMLKWATCANIILLPFILLFVAFYNLIQYGESFYNSPKLIASRSWTRISKWKFRFYNELPHLFENRMELASKEMKTYFEQFNYRILEIVSRLIVFVFSSIFLLLVFFVFVNENNLNNKGFFGFQPLLWHITIYATILAIFRNYTKSNIMTRPQESLEKANKYLYLISETNIKNATSYKIRNKMATYYQYHIICITQEILSIIITPFYYMPLLYNKSDEICDFIIEHIDNHYIMGNVSGFSIFTKYTHNLVENNPKLKYSYQAFTESHTDWHINKLELAKTIDEDSLLNLPSNSINETIISVNDNSYDSDDSDNI